jgi:predicted RNase H-like nuclease (RuvC/YqgF family)
MFETIGIIVGVIILLAMIFGSSIYEYLKMTLEKEREKEKRRKRKREAQKRSLKKHKEVYEKTIEEIEQLILDETSDKVDYDCGEIPVLVSEAVAQYFVKKDWEVYADEHHIVITLNE